MGETSNLMDYNGGTHLAKWQWDVVHDPALIPGVFEGDGRSEYSSEELSRLMPDYFGQRITNPSGRTEFTHQEALLIQNDDDQTVAYLLPDEKVFIWVNDGPWKGYFENGVKEQEATYIFYVGDKYSRKTEPVSWGIHLAAQDLGGFAIDLVQSPSETTSSLANGLVKIATLQFDIEKTWDRIVSADRTDGAYVVATILMGYLSGPKGKAVVAAEDSPRFGEMLGEFASKLRPARLTWPQLLEFFRKAKQFEAQVTSHLKTLYPIDQGFTMVNQVYLKVNGITSIADNIIYNSKTGQFILNETKYGVTNLLRKNQRLLQDAIKSGKKIEVRSVNGIPAARVLQGSQITISKILRSNSIDGTITANTVKTIWP